MPLEYAHAPISEPSCSYLTFQPLPTQHTTLKPETPCRIHFHVQGGVSRSGPDSAQLALHPTGRAVQHPRNPKGQIFLRQWWCVPSLLIFCPERDPTLLPPSPSRQVDTAGDSYIVAAGVIQVDSEGFMAVDDKGQDPVSCAHKVMAFAIDMLQCAREVRLREGNCLLGQRFIKGRGKVHAPTITLTPSAHFPHRSSCPTANVRWRFGSASTLETA